MMAAGLVDALVFGAKVEGPVAAEVTVADQGPDSQHCFGTDQ